MKFLGLDGNPIGRGENWRKWEWKYQDKGEADQKKEDPFVLHFLTATPEELRFLVWKNRRQRKFRITERGRLESIPLKKKDLPFGILAELTELKMSKEQWWTIAFEVFGDIDNPMEILQQGVNEIIKEYPGSALEVHNSYSYPEWISRL